MSLESSSVFPQPILFPAKSSILSAFFSYASTAKPKTPPREMVSIPSSLHLSLRKATSSTLSSPRFEPISARVSYSGPTSEIPLYGPDLMDDLFQHAITQL